jgi:hypothetical protein
VRAEKNLTVDELVFAEKGGLLLLGARTLERLKLTVDPRRKKLVAAGLRGSAGKTVHRLTGRYSMADREAVPAGEAVIGADGAVTLSGMDPLVVQSGAGLQPAPS